MQTLKISLLVFILSITISAQDFWEQTNGPSGGIVENIYFDQYRNTLFAGTAVAGIYYSSDKGQNWERASINIITVYCFESTEDILLAGTGEGLFESIDNGLTWSKINGDFSNYQIRDILILNNGYIFIATIGIGVYLSIDNGVTWQQKINGLNNGSINCLSVDSSQTLYAGGDELFQSTNFGDEWVQINSPGGWIGTITNENGSIYSLTNGDIFLSTNYGTDWINITQQVSGVNFWNFLISDGMIYGASGGQGIYLTSNNGGSWIEINNGMSGGDFIVHNIILVDTAIYGATNSGVIMSPTDDFTWQKVNHNLTICIIRSMFNVNNITYTGTHELGLYYTNDEGETWEEVN